MVDEETPLTGTSSSGRAKIVYEINIEKLRVFGLSAVIVLLLTGKFVTEKLNNWPTALRKRGLFSISPAPRGLWFTGFYRS